MSKKANKTNSSVRFLGESMARQSAFKINWPLVLVHTELSPRLSYHISSQNFLQYFLIFFLHFFSLPKTAPYYAIEGVTPYDVIYGLYFCFLGYSLRSTQFKSIRTHNGLFARNCSKIMWPVTHRIWQIRPLCPRSKWNMGEILAFLTQL